MATQVPRPVHSDAEQIRLPDGRTLAYCLYGPEDGTPVLFQYGMPGTMFLAPDRLHPLDDLASGS